MLADQHALVVHRIRHLLGDFQPGRIQFMRQSILINRFHKACLQGAVHFDRATDNLLSQILVRILLTAKVMTTYFSKPFRQLASHFV